MVRNATVITLILIAFIFSGCNVQLLKSNTDTNLLVILPLSQTIRAKECNVATVMISTSSGQVFTPTANVEITLTLSSPEVSYFTSLSDCAFNTNNVSSVFLSPTTATKTVYFRTSAAGSFNLVASSGIPSPPTVITASYSSFNRARGVEGFVNASVLQSDGKIVIGGMFTVFSSITSSRIARVNTDGTPDTSFSIGTGFDGDVYALALQADGKIVAGGVFTSYNGTSVSHIARLNTDGSLDTGFVIGTGLDANINALAIQSDQKILAGGDFTTYNGNSANRLVRINSNGSYDATFPTASGFNNSIYALAVQNDGNIIAAGNYTTYGVTSINRIIRLDPSAVLDATFNPGTGFTGGLAQALAIQNDGKILVGGQFTAFNGSAAGKLVRLNTDGSNDASLAIGTGFNLSVSSLAVQSDGNIIVAGNNYSQLNGVSISKSIVRLTSTGAVDPSFISGTGFINGASTTFVQPDGKIFVAGAMQSYNGNGINNIVRINSDGSLDTTFSIGSAFATYNNPVVAASTLQTDGKVLIGGLFSTFSGQPRGSIVRVNSDGTLDTTFSTGTSGFGSNVYSVAAQSDGKVIVGGSFTSYNATPTMRIARLNADGSFDATFVTGSGFSSTVRSIWVQTDGKILVGGNFTQYQGNARGRIVRLNSDGSEDATFIANSGTGFNGTVQTIFVDHNGKIVVCGSFSTYNGTSAIRYIRLNSDGTYDNTFDTTVNGFNASVNAIVEQPDGKLVMGGSFTTFIGLGAANRIARINTDGTFDNTFVIGSGFDSQVKSMALQADGKILVAGLFTTYNGNASQSIARLNTDGSWDNTYAIGTGFTDSSNGIMISLQADQKAIVSGSFTNANGVFTNGLIRLFPDGTQD